MVSIYLFWLPRLSKTIILFLYTTLEDLAYTPDPFFAQKITNFSHIAD